MSKLGVGDGTAVVVYDRQLNMWASRLWWMLRAFGFDNAAVLNGGWAKWTADSRTVSTEAPKLSPGPSSSPNRAPSSSPRAIKCKPRSGMKEPAS